MSRRTKIEIILMLLGIYFIIFFSNNDIKKNYDKINKNEQEIVALKKTEKALSSKIDKQTMEYEEYSNDLKKYVSLQNSNIALDSEITNLKNQITDYQNKLDDLNNRFKDN